VNRTPKSEPSAGVLTEDRTGGWLLSVLAVPNARKHQVEGLHGNALKIRIAAPAVEDKANRALVKYLAETLSLPHRSVRLVSGSTSRRKRIHIESLDPASLRRRLGLPESD
jgi:hypothetical protein